MIKKVGSLEVGGKLQYAGDEYTITSFPTRHTVVFENQNPSMGNPSLVKEVISKIAYSTHEKV